MLSDLDNLKPIKIYVILPKLVYSRITFIVTQILDEEMDSEEQMCKIKVCTGTACWRWNLYSTLCSRVLLDVPYYFLQENTTFPLNIN